MRDGKLVFSASLTLETFFEGRLRCLQPRQGYRFSLDAFILAHAITPAPGDRILDLGTGCGIVALLLAFRWPRVRCTGLELQPALAELARRNVELNRPNLHNRAGDDLPERLTMIEADLGRLAHHLEPEQFDWVVTNPPFRRKDAGRINPEPSKAVARHEIAVDLRAVVGAAAFAVCNRGRVTLVYPARRAATLIHALKERELEPKRLRLVHDHPGGEAWLVVVEAVKNGGEGLDILPPLLVRRAPGGAYSEEVAGYFEG